MSSRDDDNRNSRRSSNFFDVDPADIDRYLSGGKRKPSGGTAHQLERLQQSVDRANRNRSSAPEETSETTDSPPRRRGTGNSSYVTDSAYRQNRRRSYMSEDPYVSGFEDEPEPDTTASFTPVAPERPRVRREPVRTVYDDYPEYVEPANDEPDYDDWEPEEQPEPVAPRSRPERRRQSIQRPSLRKPTVPPVVANAAVLNDTPSLVMLVGSSLGLAVMAIVLANRLDGLPVNVFSHVSASGQLEDEAHRGILWNLPVAGAMMALMNLVAAWFLAPNDKFASRFLLGSSLIVQFVIWVAVLKFLW